jgi:biopolymer transport protein ExbD
MLLQNQLRDLNSVCDDHLDLTAMVDVVFQLLTFLLLTYQVSNESDVALPVAHHGVGVEETESIVLTLTPPDASGGNVAVYEGTKVDHNHQLLDDDSITNAVTEALASGKHRVVIQADAEVPHGEVLRVAGDAAKVEGVTIHIGVEEPGQ